MFAKRLRAILEERGISPAELSRMTGIGKSSISQYLSGVNIPNDGRMASIAEALGVIPEDLTGTKPEDAPPQTYDLKVQVAARLLGKSVTFIKNGLISGAFKWGYAVRYPSGKWSFYINAKKFEEIESINLPQQRG